MSGFHILVALMGQFREHRHELHQLCDLHKQWLAGPPKVGQQAAPRIGVVQQQRRLREPEIQDLIARYQAGATVADLVAHFGVHKTTVSRHLENRGVPRRLPVGMAPDEVDEAARLYEQGQSLATVGKKLGFNAMTVRTYLINAGVSIRPRRGWA